MNKTRKVLLLFSNSSAKKGLADPERLEELLQEASRELGKDMQIYTTYAKSLSFFITNKKVKIRDHRNHLNLEQYDFVYFRKAGSVMQQMMVCAQYLLDHGVPFYDSEIARSGSRNKLSQMYMLQRRGVPVPKTLFCRNNRRLLRLIDSRYAKDFSYPLIAKATGGARGDANYLVQTHEEMQKLLSNESRHFIIQEFIPNDGDMRFFITGYLSGIIKRTASTATHLNNTSKGGTAVLMDRKEVSKEVVADALLAARIFGRECAGVDVIIDKNTGQHFILEVNRAPQIEEASFESDKAKWLVKAMQRAIDTYQPKSLDAQTEKSIFGRFEAVYLLLTQKSLAKLIAKVDTGADSSSLHATGIEEKDGVLSCQIAGQTMSFTTYAKPRVRSSNGVWQYRYMVTLKVRIGSKDYPMKVTLSDRSGMTCDMLIGRRFLRTHKILVDVGRRYIASGKAKEGGK